MLLGKKLQYKKKLKLVVLIVNSYFPKCASYNQSVLCRILYPMMQCTQIFSFQWDKTNCDLLFDYLFRQSVKKQTNKKFFFV